jgi:hypothetical protein
LEGHAASEPGDGSGVVVDFSYFNRRKDDRFDNPETVAKIIIMSPSRFKGGCT